MSDIPYKTPEEINLALANYKMLKTTAGWQMLVEQLEANVKRLEEYILNGIEDETKESIDRLRDRVRIYRQVIDTPDYWIKHLETPALVQEDDDPFYTVASYHKSKKHI